MRFHDLQLIEKALSLMRASQARQTEDHELEAAIEAADAAVKRERAILEGRSKRSRRFFEHWDRGADRG